MGYSASSKVVYGVKVEFRDFPNTVTKYDPDTGKPYQKNVSEEKLTLSSTGQIIDGSLLGDDFEACSKDEFGVVYSDHARNDNRVLGAIVAEAGYDNDVDPVQMGTGIKENVIEKLAEFGINEKPLLYVITVHSY